MRIYKDWNFLRYQKSQNYIKYIELTVESSLKYHWSLYGNVRKCFLQIRCCFVSSSSLLATFPHIHHFNMGLQSALMDCGCHLVQIFLHSAQKNNYKILMKDNLYQLELSFIVTALLLILIFCIRKLNDEIFILHFIH